VIKWNDLSDVARLLDSESEDEGFTVERRNYDCGLEITTSCIKKLTQVKIRQCANLHGAFDVTAL